MSLITGGIFMRVKLDPIGQGTYYDDAYKVSFKYDINVLAKVKS